MKNLFKGLVATTLIVSCMFQTPLNADAITVSTSDLYHDSNAKYILTLDKHEIYSGFPKIELSSKEYVKKQELLSVFIKFVNKIDGISLDKLPNIYDSNQTINTKNIYSLPKEYENHWSASSVQTLVNKGFSEYFSGGYPAFNPSDNVKKSDLAFLLYLYLNAFGKIDSSLKDNSIKDIENSPYKEVIKIVVGNNILPKDENGKFEPNKYLSRGELAKLLSEYAKWETISIPEPTPKWTVLDVPYVSQLTPVFAPIGCEPVSVYQALKYKGYVKVDLRTYLDNLPFDNINPNRGFVGHWSGFKNKAKRETIFPAPLAKYAQKYASKNVEDFSGFTAEDIQKEIYLGNPVIVYLTLDMSSPIYTTYHLEGNTYRWISNNHVVTVIGYNPENGDYYVSDPYSYKSRKYWIAKKTFEYLYNLRQHAIVVR
ncbi:SLH domain protein [Peptostreptococcaceae bacterium AS15]|nr:SLH domain protein [Peptostreptococcaceae bacterium AS15]